MALGVRDPCIQLSPVIDEIAGERVGKTKVAKVNVDENQALASQYRINSIPALLFFKGGQPVKTIIGAYPKKKLEQELEPVLAAA